MKVDCCRLAGPLVRTPMNRKEADRRIIEIVAVPT
jgi:hypothetical protein